MPGASLQTRFFLVALASASITVLMIAATGSPFVAFSVGLIVSLALSSFFSSRLNRRVADVVALSRRYQSGNLTPAGIDFGDDELGTTARALDQSVQDVARRLADQARDSGRMEAVLTGMIEGVIVVDAQGRLQLVNDAARRMLKLDDSGLGRPYVETIRHPAIAELVAATLSGRTPTALQLSPPRDPSRTIVARAAPSAGDSAQGVVVVLHDITDLRRADQIRRDFVANVSHELRTPLTAIRGYVEALSEGDVDPEESRRFLEIVIRHTERMERLVKDLLRLARLDAGQETLDIIDCDTGNVLHAVTTDLASSLGQRQQSVNISIARGAETVRADPAKLHDALRNLIANAITYSPERTTIRIDASTIDSYVALTVSDEGPGIPEEDLSRVFERFYRVDKSKFTLAFPVSRP
jgi:two-component system phosphate regulon sensor histidine kinase PhoR